jgi:hypothetical protein
MTPFIFSAVGSCVLVVYIALIVVFCIEKKRRKMASRRNQSQGESLLKHSPPVESLRSPGTGLAGMNDGHSDSMKPTGTPPASSEAHVDVPPASSEAGVDANRTDVVGPSEVSIPGGIEKPSTTNLDRDRRASRLQRGESRRSSGTINALYTGGRSKSRT